MPTASSRAATFVAALLVGALLLVGCDRTAELIPGEGTPTPEGTTTAEASSSATPITVNPTQDRGSGAGVEGAISDVELALSTVQVLAVGTEGDPAQVVRYGSGVVVDTEAGLIAAAWPVVAPTTSAGARAYVSIVIAVDREGGSAPTRTFIAELAQGDADSDIAIVRVISHADGSPLSEDDFDLPAVKLGDATSVGAGFAVRALGYPGVVPDSTAGSQVVTIAQATITGQRGSVVRTGRTWFKTDARMPFGAAGGPVFDRTGALIGILAQDRYVPTALVGQVRPLDLLAPLIQSAREEETFRVPLHRTGTMPGSLSAAPVTGIYVGQPSFAENAVETPTGRDLFDYETRFLEGLAALYYEYEVNGAAAGAEVEERWFLDGVRQESLDSTVSWSEPGFGFVSDRIAAPGPAGIPSGRWRLEVYVDGLLHSSGTAIVGTSVGTASGVFAWSGALSTPQGDLGVGVSTGSSQLLMGFDLAGMLSVRELEWVVFRDNLPIYTSPTIRWEYGDAGRFWIGYRGAEPIGPGTWEIELYAEGVLLDVGTVTLF